MLAAGKGYKDIVKLLIESNADPYICDKVSTEVHLGCSSFRCVPIIQLISFICFVRMEIMR